MKDELLQRLEAADAGLTFAPDVEAFMSRIDGSALPEPRRVRWIRKRRVAAAGVLLGATLTGTAFATQASDPGDALFGLKAAVEELWASTASDDAEEAGRHLDVAEERIVQARSTLDANDRELASDLLGDAKEALESAREVIESLQDPQRASLTSRADTLQARIAELQVRLADDPGSEVEDGEDESSDSPSPHPSDEPDDDEGIEPEHDSTSSPSATHTDEPDAGDEPEEPINSAE